MEMLDLDRTVAETPVSVILCSHPLPVTYFQKWYDGIRDQYHIRLRLNAKKTAIRLFISWAIPPLVRPLLDDPLTFPSPLVSLV